MSWQLASFLVLGAVILAGFAWYERSRPPSQIVALVAALAALAVAGRLAFAAIPNVVATTDIVFFSGYALGGAPGFAVGALAAVVSNFWLGQGPWTPWQMAAWGLCGVGGAALARVTGRRLGRIGLAVACGVAGVLYGALLNFSLMASYGGELTMERFLTLEVRAIPFDAAHAIGNITLALIAGPAMVRMLIRFRERFEWRRVGAPPAPRIAIAAIVAISTVALFPAAALAGPRDARSWLSGTQNRDGGFGASPGDESSLEMTGWAALGLEAAGRNPLDVARRGNNAVEYLRRNAGEITSAGDLARTILALAAAGVEPRDFAGRNLLVELRGKIGRNGSVDRQVNVTAYTVLALRAADSKAGLSQSLDWLRTVQNEDGGWGIGPRIASESDSTGAALQAVRGSRAAREGLAYLRRTQRPSGGWALAGTGTVNSQSTAWAIQGVIAAGVDPAKVREGGNSGLDYLAARQAGNGHYRYSASSDQTPVWVTGQALVAASGDAYPLPVVARRPQPNSDSGDSQGGRRSPSAPASSPAAEAPVSSAGGAAAGGSGKERDGAKKGAGTTGATGATGPAGAGSPEAESPPTTEAEEAEPTSETAPEEGEDGEEASPLAALGIGVGAGAALLGGTVFVGRRRRW